MKIFIMHPEDTENFLYVKETHFSPENREALRAHTIKENKTPHVWFEDEDPPEAFMKTVKKFQKLEDSGDEVSTDPDP
jgi:hypothetical protein